MMNSNARRCHPRVRARAGARRQAIRTPRPQSTTIRLALTGLATAALTLPATPALASPAPSRTTTGEATALLPAASQVGRDQRFRVQFGLRADAQYVGSVIDGRSSESELAQPWGVFLTPPEARSMAYRMELNAAIESPRFQHDLHTSSDFGGLWVDQKAGGIVHVLFTHDLDAHRSELRSFFPYPAALRVDAAGHTEEELRALMNRITAERAMWASRGLELSLVQEDVVHNGVVVRFPDLRSPLLPAFHARYGSAVTMTSGSVPRLTAGTYGPCYVSGAGGKCGFIDSPPFRGGQEIDQYNASGLVVTICTSGFPVYRRTGVLGDTFWVLTASHCGPLSSRWEQVATPVGSANASAAGSGYDGMTISTAGGSSVVHGQILRTVVRSGQTWDGVYDPIYSQQGQDADYVGEPMCQAGITSAYVCGQEVIHSENLCLPTCYNFLRESSYASKGGDSGGPNYDTSGTAIGTTTADDQCSCGTNQSVWQQIYDTTHALSVLVLTT